MRIKSGVHLVVQFLSEAENLKNNEIILLLRKRNLATKDYHEFIEFKYVYNKVLPTLSHLRVQLSVALNIPPTEISVAKYIPHAYDWRYWDPNEEIEVKKKKRGKKGKKNQNSEEEKKVEMKKMIELDLRTAPFLLSEGDILGVRDDTEEGAIEDDFQTEADIRNRERLEELKKLDKSIKDSSKKPTFNDPFKIYTDF